MNDWHRLTGALVLMGSIANGNVSAQQQKRIVTEVRFALFLFDNYFQAPDDLTKEGVMAGETGATLTWSLDGERPRELYGGVAFIAYKDLGSSPRFSFGLNSPRRPQAFDLGVQLELNRPQVDVGDELGRADTFRLMGTYSYRLDRNWQFTALPSYSYQTFELNQSNTNHLFNIGGAVRYRGFGYKFSPEVGFVLGKRDAVDENQSMAERDLFLRLRYAPTTPLYISARLRHRLRSYSVEETERSNFGREDRRLQFSLSITHRFSFHLAGNLYYSFVNADSTRTTRIFNTQLLILALAVTL